MSSDPTISSKNEESSQDLKSYLTKQLNSQFSKELTKVNLPSGSRKKILASLDSETFSSDSILEILRNEIKDSKECD